MIALLSGNSRILLTVDERGSWVELYYPHPGLHQHLQESRLGLFDEETKALTWVDQEGEPPVEMSYLERSNAARTRVRRLALDLTIDDMVHPNLDLVIRRVTVTNPGSQRRRVRLFHYQSFNIAGSLYQDTAYWDPERKTVNHYKRGYYFQLMGRPDFDHYTCGEHTLKGLKGSYVDADDGALAGNGISHGAADSVVQWNVDVPGGEERTVHLMFMMERSRPRINELYATLKDRDPALFTAETTGYWSHWVDNKQLVLAPELSARVRDVYHRSLFVIHDCQSEEGAIVASPDARTLKSGGDTYNYCWWRDGAYVSRAMSEVGLHRGTIAFLRFAAKCQEEEGHFVHRHFPDGSVGSTWHPPPFLQADQTGGVLDAVWYYYERSGALDELLPSWPMVRRGADFLMDFVDGRGLPRPSFDLWEERKSVNAFSVGAVIRGLRGAARVAQVLGKRSEFWVNAAQRMHDAARDRFWNPQKKALHKSLDPLDPTIDASTLVADLLAPDDPRFSQLVQTVEDHLWNHEVGGLARYEGDQYYGRQNPWIICTLWLAQAHLKMGRPERCRELIEWVAEQAGPTFLLPEQIDAKTGEHVSVTPLVWSHSTFIETVNAYTHAASNPAAHAKLASPARE